MRNMDNSREYRSVGLPVGIRRRAIGPYLAVRIGRAVDRAITAVQEWLEGPDRRVELAVAYGIIVSAVVCMAAAVVRRLAG